MSENPGVVAVHPAARWPRILSAVPGDSRAHQALQDVGLVGEVDEVVGMQEAADTAIAQLEIDAWTPPSV